MANTKSSIHSINQQRPAEGETEWVNGYIEAQVSNCRDSSGKGPSTCTLTDETGSADASFWGRGISQYSGNTIKISGKGISVKTYKGKSGLSIADKAAIQITGDSQPSRGAATQGGGVSAQSGTVFDQSPVRERVHAYMEILKEVSAQYKHLLSEAPEGSIPKLTASDIKDIATHVSMTYRGDLGSYAKPIFKKPEAPKPQRQEEDHYDNSGGDITEDDIPFDSAWRKLGSSVF